MTAQRPLPREGIRLGPILIRAPANP